MNMKKTIAAIAAGAMAVSAMASSVSAIELADKVLTYNLVATHKEFTNGSVTISGSIASVNTLTGNKTYLKVSVSEPAGMEIQSITVSGYYNGDVSKPIQPYTRVKGNDQENWGDTVKNGYVEIPISATGAGAGWLLADSNTTLNIDVVYSHLTDQLTEINNKLSSINIIAETNDYIYVPGGYYVDNSSSGANNDTKDDGEKTYYWVTSTGYSALSNAGKDGQHLPSASATEAKTEEDMVKNYAVAGRASDLVVKQGGFVKRGEKEYKLPFATYANGNENIVYYLQNNNVRDGSQTSPNGSYTNVLPTINDAIANYGTVTFTFTTAAQPIQWVANGDYSNPYGPGRWNTTQGGYNDALAAAKGNANNVTAIYAIDGEADWAADKSYTSFTQHLYNGTDSIYASQAGWSGFAGGEEFYGGLWGDNNLFGGALVINENLTMRLSDVDMFDYTETTLSFDWDAISADATNYNAYATYVQSIKLATSTTWYWDKMDITLADVMAADATGDLTVGEGDVANETPVDDTDDAGEEITDPADDIEEPADEPEEPADEPADEAPAEVAPNPTTGNAPVALAVIPVALAAAAVVAKKRG